MSILRKRTTDPTTISLEKVTNFTFYFLITILLTEFILNTIFTVHSIKSSSDDIIRIGSSKIEYQISNTINILQSLSKSEMIQNPKTSYQEKAKELNHFKDSFNYMSLLIADKKANIYDTSGNIGNYSNRSYIQNLFAAKSVQIADCHPADKDGKTLTFVISVPILKDNKINGCLIATLYYTEIEDALRSTLQSACHEISLWGSNNQVMTTSNKDQYGKSYFELAQKFRFYGTTLKQVEEDMLNSCNGTYWNLGAGDLWYTSYQPIKDTNWTIMYRTGLLFEIKRSLPKLLSFFLVSIILCIIINAIVKKFIRTQMNTVQFLMNSINDLQKQLYNDDEIIVDFNEIINLTSKGLIDNLTGLLTRTVFLRQLELKLKNLEFGACSALCFIDLDNLKQINDTYGHYGGDISIKSISYVLRMYEKKHDGIASRYGGDEFCLFLTGFSSYGELIDELDDLLICLHSNATLDSKTVIDVHCSVGVAVYHGESLEQLIKYADEALYFVKQNGKDNYHIYGNN